MTRPRVSILIPNFNNGVESSLDGRTDLIGDLLRSLRETLHDDPTPFELMVNDDASTDDSIETLRDWSSKAWPDGRPFLTLVESPHEGAIAKANNRMYARAEGDILVRLDGDIVCLTRHWVSRIVEVFGQGPANLGIVGPKQLTPDLRIHAMGDWLLHPNGYTHIAMGLDRYAVRFPVVCDHNMGCFYCCRKAMFDDIGGYDETCLRGETEDLTMMARLKGWTAIAVPHVEFVHRHGMRKTRSSRYDQQGANDEDLAYFEKKWGFSRLAPDLDVVRERWAGTPLVANARWLSPGPVADPPPSETPLTIEASDWARYANDKTFQAAVNRRLSATTQIIEKTESPRRPVLLNAGDGLLAHLLAKRGVAATGVEPDPARLDLARKCVMNQSYPGEPPTFIAQPDRRKLPLDDGSADMLFIVDVLERHPNPVAILKEAMRVLEPGKPLVVVTPRGGGLDADAPLSPEHRYTWTQLSLQLKAMGFHSWTPEDAGNPELIAAAAKPKPDADAAGRSADGAIGTVSADGPPPASQARVAAAHPAATSSR